MSEILPVLDKGKVAVIRGILGVATHEDRLAGFQEAIAARKMSGKITVVGVDATGEAIRAIEAGRMPADVALHPEALGNKAVAAAIQAAKGQPVDKLITTGETLVTKETSENCIVPTQSRDRQGAVPGRRRNAKLAFPTGVSARPATGGPGRSASGKSRRRRGARRL